MPLDYLSVLIKSLIRGSSWLDFDPSEQVLYLEMYAALPVKEQTAEGAMKLSQRIANRKVWTMFISRVNTWWICVVCRKGCENLQQCWSSANHQITARRYTRLWKIPYWLELWMKLVDKEQRKAPRWSKIYGNWYSLCHIVNFQWKDTVAPLFQFFDTKRVVLQTSVGASSKQRLEELQKMDAKYVTNSYEWHRY